VSDSDYRSDFFEPLYSILHATFGVFDAQYVESVRYRKLLQGDLGVETQLNEAKFRFKRVVVRVKI
jgi:hypothetical protein